MAMMQGDIKQRLHFTTKLKKLASFFKTLELYCACISFVTLFL